MPDPLLDKPLSDVIIAALSGFALVVAAWFNAKRAPTPPPVSVEAGPKLVGTADQITEAVRELGFKVRELEKFDETAEEFRERFAVLGYQVKELQEIRDQMAAIKHILAETAQGDKALKALGITREDVIEARKLRFEREGNGDLF